MTASVPSNPGRGAGGLEPQFNAFVRAYEDDHNFTYRRFCEAPSFFKALGSVEGLSVLDQGCGAGLYTRRLRERGAARVVGLDIAPNMLAYARAREAELRQGIEYVLDDASHAGRLGTFDAVTAIYALPYAATQEHLRAMCQGAFDALKPGGRFVAVTVNPLARFTDADFYVPHGMRIFPARPELAGVHPLPDGAQLRLVSHILGKPIDVTPYQWRRETYEALLREAGFQRVEWHPMDVSAEGLAELGAEHWRALLENPPAVPLVCVK